MNDISRGLRLLCRPISRGLPRRLALLLGLISFGLTLGLGALPPASATLPPGLVAQAASPTPQSLADQARQLFAAQDYGNAARLWQQAADLFEQAGDRLEQARSLNNAAQAHQQLGEWQAASQVITTSLNLFAADLAASPVTLGPETLQVVGQTSAVQGSLALAQSRPQAAAEAFEQAVTYYRAAGDASGVLRQQVNQARALQANGYYRRAIELLEAGDLSTAEGPAAAIAAGLRTLGELKRAVGELAAAQTVLEQSLQMAQQIGDRSAIAAAQFSLGTTAVALEQPDQAQAWFDQVLRSDPTPELAVQVGIAQLRLIANFPEPTELALQLDPLKTKLSALPPSRLRTYGYIDAATVLMQRPETEFYSPAARFLAQARQDAQALGDIRAESYAMGTLGQLYRRTQQLEEAEILTENALALAVKANAPEVSYRWNAQLGSLKRAAGQTQEAINHYTAAVSTLQSLRTDLVAISDDVRFNFREIVEPIYRDLVDLLTASPQAPQANLLQARDVIESLQLAELENFFREACLAVTQKIDQVIDSTEQPTAVVYPIILGDRLEVILKLPQQPLTHYAVPIARADLEAQLAQLRTDLVLPYTLKQVQAEAAQLYDWLLKPVESQLASRRIDTLVFVLDGALRNIPMGLLYDGDQYLIEKYSVAIAPGLQLVDPQPLSDQALAAITAGLSEARHGFAALQYVENEINQLENTLSSQVLLNQNFTESNLAGAISDISFPVVHLATHGQFSSNPEETFILAWDKSILLDSLNQILRSSEQSRTSAIELLVLSACETASGDQRAALGLAGVAVRAGARSTLASLWSLDDETTALLMDQFYRALKTPGITRAAALQAAQTAILNNPRYEHPRYWAPYVLVGNWL
ncbi:hypothetical protein C7271_16550 [filamentous cyanobacterium CCP5]|nr:hypothetical protein C7271_16550 [filamentous cyanobacterium CCP5]